MMYNFLNLDDLRNKVYNNLWNLIKDNPRKLLYYTELVNRHAVSPEILWLADQMISLFNPIIDIHNNIKQTVTES